MPCFSSPVFGHSSVPPDLRSSTWNQLTQPPFAQIHRLLSTSGIPFSKNPWPYTPHCTLRTGEPLSNEDLSMHLSQSFPTEVFWISTISVYHLDDTRLDCKLLCQRALLSFHSLLRVLIFLKVTGSSCNTRPNAKRCPFLLRFEPRIEPKWSYQTQSLH